MAMRWIGWRRFACGALLTTLALALAGCGDGRLSGGGEVTVDKKPLNDASITFLPADGEGPAALAEIKNGRYDFTSADGPMTGAHKIVIRRIPAAKFGATELPALWESTYDVPAAGPFEKDFALAESDKQAF